MKTALSNPHTAIRCDAVRVSIGELDLVRGVSFEVVSGTWLSVIGPNGAGKSTLLRALVGAIAASGTTEIMGRPLADFARRELAQTVAWVSQTPQVPAGIKVVDYLLLGRTPYLSPLGRESQGDRDIAAAVIEDLDLRDVTSRDVDTLSGGERQRVLIGRALVQQTPILLLDEPTSALDLGHQQEVLDLLAELRDERQLTIVSTMHDLSLAGQYTDQMLLLADGEQQALGPPRDVLTAELIEQHYRARAEVMTTADGSIVVIPRSRTARSQRDA